MPSRRRLPQLCLALAAALATALPVVPADAAELSGVRLDDSVKVGDETLVLNGLGLRKKLFVKVYVGGLYLPKKQSDGKAILAADTPRRIVMHFVYDVGKDQLCDAWKEGLENNTANPGAALRKDFDTLCSWMEDIDEGERMVLTYVPGTGTTVTVNGRDKGTLPGKAFADAAFGAYIGPAPPTADFKEGLLGG